MAFSRCQRSGACVRQSAPAPPGAAPPKKKNAPFHWNERSAITNPHHKTGTDRRNGENSGGVADTFALVSELRRAGVTLPRWTSTNYARAMWLSPPTIGDTISTQAPLTSCVSPTSAETSGKASASSPIPTAKHSNSWPTAQRPTRCRRECSEKTPHRPSRKARALH